MTTPTKFNAAQIRLLMKQANADVQTALSQRQNELSMLIENNKKMVRTIETAEHKRQIRAGVVRVKLADKGMYGTSAYVQWNQPALKRALKKVKADAAETNKAMEAIQCRWARNSRSTLSSAATDAALREYETSLTFADGSEKAAKAAATAFANSLQALKLS
tara:strand:+ start:1176 stop:1661 length:486 start_codon:yes stop_codon:yes gene_type:complete